MGGYDISSDDSSDDDEYCEMSSVVRSIAAAMAASTSGANNAFEGGGLVDDATAAVKSTVSNVGSAMTDIRAALTEDNDGSSSSAMIKDAIDLIARPSQIPGRITDALMSSKMLNLEEDEDDDGITRFVIKLLGPIMRLVLWLRSSLVRPLLLVIPEWAILLYLVGRSVTVAILAVRIKQKSPAQRAGKALNDDVAFANMYSASAIVFGVLSMVLFALLAGRSVSSSVVAVVLSCAGVCASALLDRLLRAADTGAFRASESTPEGTERRMLFMHGGTGLAFAAATMAISTCCPF